MDTLRITIVAAIAAFFVTWRRRLSGSLAFGQALRQAAIPLAGAAVITGQRGTNNVLADVYDPDFGKTVAELESSAAPLVVLTQRLNKDKVINPKYTWFEDQLQARFDTVNNGPGYLSTDTSIVVTTGTMWAADDLLYVTRTGELLRVTAVSTNTLTVVRGVGSTAAALNNAEEILRIGSAAMQGAADKPARSTNPTEVFNYTQIEREPIEITGTAKSTANRVTPADWDRAIAHAGIEHSKNKEYACMFGHPSIDTSGAQPRTTTGGFNHYATSNITDVGGQMTESEFYDAIRPVFRYDSMAPRAAFCAGRTVDIINAYGRGKLELIQADKDKTYGLDINQMVGPGGRVVNLIVHWLLEGATFGNQIWLVNLKHAGYRYLHGDNGPRDTHTRENIQAPGVDGQKNEILTEFGFVLANPQAHGKIVNITS